MRKGVKDNNFKVDYTTTKFGIDIKNYDGIIKKKTNNGYYYHLF
jgi:hypothetical protein